MAQEQVQIQTQKQQQVQRLSQQQMLQVKLLEMPLTELEESVNAELDDNPALEAGGEESDSIDTNDSVEQREDDDLLWNVCNRMTTCRLTIQDSNATMLTMRRLFTEIPLPLSINSMSKWANWS